MKYSHTTGRLNAAGMLLTIATLFGISTDTAHCQGTFTDPGDPQHRVTVLSAPNSVANYGAFEAALQIGTQASNLQLPYDAVEPSYASHLFPDEDAAHGVSVDGLFLPPGQNNWAYAEDQPAFYFQGYDNNFPTGEKDWHLRFAPNTVGVWQYRVRVADAQGVALGSPQTFTVTPSSSHGFVGVSPTDSRYFQYSDGTPFLAAGDDDLTGGEGALQNCAQGQAVALHRIWIAGNGGMEIVGGGGNIQTFQGVSFNPSNAEPLAGVGHNQRFALQLNSTSAGIECNWANVKPDRTYTLTAWVKLQGAPGQAPEAQFSWQSVGGDGLAPVPVADDGQWHSITETIAPGNYGPNFVVEMLNRTTGGNVQYPFLLDDLCITDNATEEPIYGGIGMDWVTRYNQINSAKLDQLLSLAMSSSVPQYLKLTCFQHEDPEWGAIGPDGSSLTPPLPTDSVGGSTDPKADTAVQRFQGYFARYVMARWGWSPAVMGVEHVNEGDPNNGIYFAGAQSFASHVHALTADHYVLASTSGWNEGRGGYNWNFYQNWNTAGTGPGIYPDIDYADVHDYVLAGTTAYNTMQPFYPGAGGSVSATGGPNGLGMLTLSTAADTALPVARLCGVGTWTIKFFYKTSSDATFNSPVGNWYTHGGGQVAASSVPNPYSATPAKVVPNWTEYTQTFAMSQQEQGESAQVVRGLLNSGTEYFADVRIYDPSGALWMRQKFDEPNLMQDYAAYSEYLPLTIESYSGIPAIGKPLVIGETEPVGNDSQGMSDNTRARLDPNFDPSGNAVRQMAWGSIGSGVAIFQWWYEFAQETTNTSSWKFYGYVQKFLSGLPLSNGHYRNADAAVSTSQLIAIGQKDTTANQAYLYVYNRQANWDAIARGTTIAPVTGTVAITGLANGSYTVQRWNPGMGTILSTETDVAAGGLLTIPMNALAQDVALKISPAPVAVALTISAPPVTAPLSTAGDTLAIHSGGGAVGGFVADEDFVGGTSVTTTSSIATNGVTNAAPQAIYQTGRIGTYGYEFKNLPPNTNYTVRLHFAETQATGPGQRLFSIIIGGVWVLENFDIFKTAGGQNHAVVQTFKARSTPSGMLLVLLQASKGNTEINGIELHP
jgi:hypothetical protein